MAGWPNGRQSTPPAARRGACHAGWYTTPAPTRLRPRSNTGHHVEREEVSVRRAGHRPLAHQARPRRGRARPGSRLAADGDVRAEGYARNARVTTPPREEGRNADRSELQFGPYRLE